ncbi:MAG: hypothetical protein LBQ38_04050 [Spirochaetaceae bacterium]|nr:hypothetical protein [Spirochaetaceae bacterium]
MKRIVILLAVFTVLAGLIGAQEENRFSLGIGIEGNMNTPGGFALGGNVGFAYGITDFIAIGIKAGYSNNLERIMVLEPGVFARYYFFTWEEKSLFAQLDLGASLIFEEALIYPTVMGGLSVGLRIPLASWYVEPAVRGGYPYVFGAGLTAGYRF